MRSSSSHEAEERTHPHVRGRELDLAAPRGITSYETSVRLPHDNVEARREAGDAQARITVVEHLALPRSGVPAASNCRCTSFFTPTANAEGRRRVRRTLLSQPRAARRAGNRRPRTRPAARRASTPPSPRCRAAGAREQRSAAAATAAMPTTRVIRRLGMTRSASHAPQMRGAATLSITPASRSSGLRPSSSASGASAMRWRSAGSAMRLMSSGVTKSRPSSKRDRAAAAHQRDRAARARARPRCPATRAWRARCARRSRRPRRSTRWRAAICCRLSHRALVEHRLHLGERQLVARLVGGGADHDADFVLERRIADLDLEQEAVELRLGQRIGAFGLDRILRREHHERLRQRHASGLRGSPGIPA